MRAAWIGMLLVASAGLADAQQAKGGAKPPMTLVPCLPQGGDFRLASNDGEPVVCWDQTCMALPPEGTARLVPPPTNRPSWLGPRAEVRDDGGKPSVCMGGSCKAVGARLAVAINTERKSAIADQRQPSLEATADRKAVVVSGTVWNVASDKALALKLPSSYKGGPDVAGVVGIEVVGNLLLVDWSDCAGPCTVGQLVDSSGKNRGKPFDGGGQVFQLDPNRFVAMSEYAAVRIFDLGGKPLGTLVLGDDVSGYDAIPLDDSTIGVLRPDREGHRLVVINAFDDSPLRISSEQFLPSCQP